jgi:F-type H+-transporting ATPase subunit delta
MPNPKATKIYSQALFDISKEGGSLDIVRAELTQMAEMFNSSMAFSLLFSSAQFSKAERRRVWKEAANMFASSDLLRNFGDLLISKGRMRLLPEIACHFSGLCDEKNGIVRGTVATVEPISEKECDELSKAFSRKLAKTVILKSAPDRTILGGLIVSVQGMTFDGSLRTTMRQLKDRLERQSI